MSILNRWKHAAKRIGLLSLILVLGPAACSDDQTFEFAGDGDADQQLIQLKGTSSGGGNAVIVLAFSMTNHVRNMDWKAMNIRLTHASLPQKPSCGEENAFLMSARQGPVQLDMLQPSLQRLELHMPSATEYCSLDFAISSSPAGFHIESETEDGKRLAVDTDLNRVLSFVTPNGALRFETGETDSWTAELDAAKMLASLDIGALLADSEGVIRIDANHNPDALAALLPAILSAFTIYGDTNDNGVVDTNERREENIVATVRASGPCLSNSDCPENTICLGGVCSSLGCADNAQCDDANECTWDACDAATGVCANLPAVEGQPCQGGTCQDGECLMQPICTTDADCEAGFHCVAGVCVFSDDPDCSGVNCDDANPCTTDDCDAMTGMCVHAPLANGAACPGGFCQDGVCEAGCDPVCEPYEICANGLCIDENEYNCQASGGECFTVSGVGDGCPEGYISIEPDLPVCGEGEVCCVVQECVECAGFAGEYCLAGEPVGDGCNVALGEDFSFVIEADESSYCGFVIRAVNPTTGEEAIVPLNGCDLNAAPTILPVPHCEAMWSQAQEQIDFACQNPNCTFAFAKAACQTSPECAVNDDCDAGYLCVSGICVSPDCGNCDDGNVCTADTCDAGTGTCQSVPLADGTACPEGVCLTGSCVPAK
ncbi:MAG: hypothetical protein C4523_17990 [Myxococcales bacterium]|nr:MAG: hypothetical protein C4523_17990 [Myxococcales bacterium]